MHEECLGEKKYTYIYIFLKRKKLENTCARRALWEEGGRDSVLISYFRVLARTPVQ